jgi:hypothetical protein
MHVREYPGLDVLPASYSDLLEWGGRRDLRLSRPWLEAVTLHGVPTYAAPLVLGLEDAAGLPCALSVGLSSERYSEGFNGRALILAQSDDTVYRPLAAHGVPPLGVLRMVARHARRADRPYDVLRVSPLDIQGDLFRRLPSVLRAEGWIPQPFFMFHNWYQRVDGLSSDEFLRERPSRLRSTIERRTRRLVTSGRSRIELIGGGPTLDTFISDYKLVFARSWKRGPSHISIPYLHATMQIAAQAGALRLALLYVDNVPAATQFWLIINGAAHLSRLAYDERFRDLSPGTVLTWHVVRHMLDAEKVQELDLGLGDDAYKAEWVSGRRERWGILGFNPRTPGGLKAAARNIGGRVAKRVARALLRPLIARLRGG